MTSIRYADLSPETNGAKDFIIRKRLPTIVQLLIVIVTVFLIAFSLSVAIDSRFKLFLLMSTLFSIAGWYVIVAIQRNRDLVLATEFQNALFASALGLNNKFCLIIRRDGNIVYLDRSFQEVFPDFMKQPRKTIEIFLEQGRVSKEETEKVFAAIDQGVFSKVVFNIRGAGSQFHKMIVSVEPILRPTGFVLLRGREFIESRATGSAENVIKPASVDSIDKNSVTLFSHVLDSMKMGVYMTTPSGNLVYANPILESWLSYGEGELTASNRSLQDIIYQSGGRSEQIEPADYEGEVMLQKKGGEIMKAFINQKVIRDDQHKIMGCTALVHPYTEPLSDMKKKLW